MEMVKIYYTEFYKLTNKGWSDSIAHRMLAVYYGLSGFNSWDPEGPQSPPGVISEGRIRSDITVQIS